jgi:hypothetical protein
MRPMLLALVTTVASAAALAEDVAFVEPTSELDDGRPASYVWNAIDGKDTTAWCSKQNPEGEALAFGFDAPVTVTQIGVVVGAVKGSELDKARKRARLVYVSDQQQRREVTFKDEPGLQMVDLPSAAKGQRIVIEFAQFYEGGSPGAPVCVGEIVLKGKGGAMSGERTGTKVRGLNTPSRRILHEWLDDPSAPSKMLIFNLDGTFTYKFTPLLEGKPAKVRGKWIATAGSVTLDVGGKTFSMKTQLTAIDEGDGKTQQLTLSGEGPHSQMAGDYKLAPLKLLGALDR